MTRRPFEPDCPFCQIVIGEGEARVVFEDDLTLAFFPDHPATLGHVLIIPKSHYDDFLALPPRLSARVWASANTAAHAVHEAIRPQGINLITSAGRAATQSVFHVHLHVVPRWGNDRIDDFWPGDDAIYSDPQQNEALQELRRVVAQRFPKPSLRVPRG